MIDNLINQEAEQELLGSFLTDNQLVIEFPIEIDIFHIPIHQRIFTAIKQKVEQGLLANPVTLKDIFDNEEVWNGVNGTKYIIRLFARNISQANVKSYIQILQELDNKRKIYQMANTVIESLKMPKSDIYKILNDFNTLSENIVGDSTLKSFIDAGEVAQQILDDVKLDKKPYTTGLKCFDNVLDGGFETSRLYCFSARAKVGKSQLLGTFAQHLASQENLKVWYASFEMKAKEISQRIHSRLGEFYTSSYKNTYSQSADFYNKFTLSCKWNMQNLVYSELQGVSFEKFKIQAEIAIKTIKPKVIIIDYYQLIKCEGSKEIAKANDLENIANWLASFAKKHDIVMIIAAQINQNETTLGGEGIRRACDAHYWLKMENFDTKEIYVECLESRSSKGGDIGDANTPKLRINKWGGGIDEI
jgi:replicative DNA helicase